MKILILTLTLTLSLLSDALLIQGKRPYSMLDRVDRNNVGDTLYITQKPSLFTKNISPLSKYQQKIYDRAYNKKLFSPWHTKKMGISWRKRHWQFKFSKQRTYTISGKSIKKKWFRYQIKNSNMKSYQSINRSAITIRHTDLKLFPSKRGIYYHPRRTGEGFPFDYNQNSSLSINTPLIVSHYSKDKKWVFVKSGYAFGWLPIQDIAFATAWFKKKFENNNYTISIKDNLYIKDNSLKTIVKLGTLFPFDSKKRRYIFAKKNGKGYAQLGYINLSNKNFLASKPLSFTAKNIAKIAKEFIREPYGWGGKLYARDCSSFTRDFFAPFGIFLRRNSVQQLYDGKKIISLRYMSHKKKRETILKYGKPFRTLLFVKGHIALYIGQLRGEPIIMHNYWGVRLNNGSKCILGRTIITTTRAGREMPNIRPRSFLINTFSKMIIF